MTKKPVQYARTQSQGTRKKKAIDGSGLFAAIIASIIGTLLAIVGLRRRALGSNAGDSSLNAETIRNRKEDVVRRFVVGPAVRGVLGDSATDADDSGATTTGARSLESGRSSSDRASSTTGSLSHRSADGKTLAATSKVRAGQAGRVDRAGVATEKKDSSADDALAELEHGVLYRLGHGCAKHAGKVTVLWLIAIGLLFGTAFGAFTSQPLFDRTTTAAPTVPGEAHDGHDILSAKADGAPVSSFVLTKIDGSDQDAASFAAELLKGLKDEPNVEQLINPFVFPQGPKDPQAAGFLPRDSENAQEFLTLVKVSSGTKDQNLERLEEIGKRAEEIAADNDKASVRVSSSPEFVKSFAVQAEKDLFTGEVIALPVSVIVMIFVFGGFLAAGLPLVGAVSAVAGGMAALLGISYLIDLDNSAINIVTVLGLGLSIDYGLLMVSRFREELNRGGLHNPTRMDKEAIWRATGRTVASAGRTVLFSGLTVAISLGGLLVFASSMMRAYGAAASAVVAFTLLCALTLTAALCALFARRIGGGSRRAMERPDDEGWFYRYAKKVQRRPIVVLTATTLLLLFLASPILGLKVTSSGYQMLPPGQHHRDVFATLHDKYPTFAQAPVTVVGKTSLEEATQWASKAKDFPGVASVGPVREVSDGVVSIAFQTDVPIHDTTSHDLANYVRDHRPDFNHWVTGGTPLMQEFTWSAMNRAGAAAAIIVLATFTLLFLMTGSVVIPIKAIIMNILSLAASIGIVVWVFQEGHLTGVLNFESLGALEMIVPILMVAFGFGLSMDYEVFLLSRIMEKHHEGYDCDEAVARGLQRSGRIITFAALLIVIVFTGFLAGELLAVKQMGFALAVAVIVDATLVRMLLVPATMTLLGKFNFWAPKPLRKIHDKFGITE